ncbi:sensor histidine kinase [Lewinella sp. IMCC34191]|uniref:sensor histidine kinase n=1 Tax=Lewinella sp. IMCC34191 TaxID=2259172 RepID=UPI000E28395C|nr:ATP-binding protein [Lewinella sp. IMCC34191]
MLAPAIPSNEEARVRALHAYNILDTLPERQFDNIVNLAAKICGTPVSLISLVDSDRCWFKAKIGVGQMTEAPRRIAYAAHAINSPTEQMVVEDALTDDRFCDCPLVTADPPMRFYVGTPLVDAGGFVLGTLCVIDHRPRKLDALQLDMLRTLAVQTVDQIYTRLEINRIEALNRELEAKNEELDQYASIISHDLKQPLRTVRGFLDIIHEDYGDDLQESLREYLALIDKTTGHMQNMVHNMLAYARVGTQRQRTAVSLHRMLAEITVDFAQVIRERRASITVDKSLPEVYGYAPEIRQLLQNLISNALKFVAPTVIPQLRISAKETHKYWRISVADNGIGIPARQRRNVFRLFERLHDSSEFEGQGIGLAFCSKIVKLHGGEVGVTGNESGGSTFWFTIPKVKAVDQSVAA